MCLHWVLEAQSGHGLYLDVATMTIFTGKPTVRQSSIHQGPEAKATDSLGYLQKQNDL